jgi:ABC-2 type transport system ATP-binding protein
MQPAIKFNNLSVTLDGYYHAIQDIDMELPAGQIIGFIGPSGAGKTTLIRSIIGRQAITRGSIKILGLPAGSVQLRSEIGYMPQEMAAYPDLTVRQNLRYFAKMRGKGGNEIEAIIKTIDLGKQADQLVATLSGGQKSRVSLAIALLGKPKILVLDEPTVGIDPVLRQQLWQLFRKLASEGSTLIVSSHIMDEAGRCDRLVLIRDGKLLAYGAPDELKERTGAHSVEESFLALIKDKR